MSAPKRFSGKVILASDGCQDWPCDYACLRRGSCDRKGDVREFSGSYTRDDAILSDPRVKALVEAVEHERNMVCQDIDMQLKASEAVDVALAAIKEGK